jgi:ATP-binding cassette subfamily B protein
MSYQSAPQTSNIRSVMQRRPADPGKIEKARDPRRALSGLLRYLGPFKGRLSLVFVFVIIYTVLGLIGPYLMGVAIDRFISTKQVPGLVVVALWMLAVYLLNNLFQAVASWIMSDISQRSLKQMRKDLFTQLQRLPIAFFDRNPAGELMSRLTNDIDAINQAVSQNVTSLIASVLSMAGILVAMFTLDRWLAMASLLVLPIMFWFTQFVALYTRKGFRELQKHLGEMNSVMEESLSGEKVIKAFQRNDTAVETFHKRNQAVFKAGVYANSYALLLMPLTNVLGNFFVIVLAGLGGWLALRTLVSVGIIATFISYGQNFINPLRQIANLYNSIQGALAGAERVFEVIDTPAEPDAGPQSPAFRSPKGHVRF